ncbi:hypothetical protein EDB19DRAFT_1869004 [Suillus lakei]|nr:hypothetical protein EDB19DRAFT_1869004 [Suillus lakei]
MVFQGSCYSSRWMISTLSERQEKHISIEVKPTIWMVKTLSHDRAFLAGVQFWCRLLVQCYFVHAHVVSPTGG